MIRSAKVWGREPYSGPKRRGGGPDGWMRTKQCGVSRLRREPTLTAAATFANSAAATARRPVAVVTGASGGIGLELARLLRRDGFELVMVARDEGRLRAAASAIGAVDARLIALDLADPGAVDALTARYAELFPGAPNATGAAGDAAPDVLVNNAGFGEWGAFAESDPEAMRGMMALNMTALTGLTRAWLPAMIRRRGGRVMNVASVAAFGPGPMMAVYYATKAYVLSLSDALSEELRASGSPVTVTALCPGPTRTGFQTRAGMGFSRLAGGADQGPAAVAEAGHRAMMSGRRTAIPGLKNRMLALLARLMPRALTARMVMAMQAGRKPPTG